MVVQLVRKIKEISENLTKGKDIGKTHEAEIKLNYTSFSTNENSNAIL